MRSPASQIVTALVLIVAGLLLWTAGSRYQRQAQAEKSLATLQYARAETEHDQVRAPAAYWLGKYDDAQRAADPFLAANAAYRAAVAQGGDWRAVVGRLDGAIGQYAEALRTNPGHPDAAYNYEFAIRYRAALAARQQNVAADAGGPDRTVHGLAGAPPDTSDLKKFKVIIPMRPEERREAEEAGKSGRRIRKG
jgi:tetratricopeptide (TPR) repeat protein